MFEGFVGGGHGLGELGLMEMAGEAFGDGGEHETLRRMEALSIGHWCQSSRRTMSTKERFPASLRIWRAVTGRVARLVYVTIFAVLLFLTCAIRISSYVLTRRMNAVIAGLSKLEIDKTSEDDLVRTVPYLVKSPGGGQLKRTAETGDIDVGVARFYNIVITNEPSWMRFGRYITPLVTCCVKVEYTKEGYERGWIFTLADLMGYRYIYFGAYVELLDGRVSRVSYGVEDRLGFPRRIFQIVLVESAHSRWAPYRTGFEVRSTDDESPDYRVEGGDYGLFVSYMYDAPQELTSHAFQIDLHCFWGLRACHHVRQIASLLWQDRNRIEAATLARLQSDKPCPDRILAGRVHYLPDVGVLILESEGLRASSSGGSANKYRLVEAVRNGLVGRVMDDPDQDTVPYPGDYSRRLPNRGVKWPNAGQQVVAFSNLHFDSCGTVLATPSALSVVRGTIPAPRRSEDQILRSLQ